jgi:hypothetical protein
MHTENQDSLAFPRGLRIRRLIVGLNGILHHAANGERFVVSLVVT